MLLGGRQRSDRRRPESVLGILRPAAAGCSRGDRGRRWTSRRMAMGWHGGCRSVRCRDTACERSRPCSTSTRPLVAPGRSPSSDRGSSADVRRNAMRRAATTADRPRSIAGHCEAAGSRCGPERPPAAQGRSCPGSWHPGGSARSRRPQTAQGRPRPRSWQPGVRPGTPAGDPKPTVTHREATGNPRGAAAVASDPSRPSDDERKLISG